MKTFDDAMLVVMLPANDPTPILEQDLRNALDDVKASEIAQVYLTAICQCVWDECVSRGFTVDVAVKNVAINAFAGGLRVGQEMEKGS